MRRLAHSVLIGFLVISELTFKSALAASEFDCSIALLPKNEQRQLIGAAVEEQVQALQKDLTKFEFKVLKLAEGHARRSVKKICSSQDVCTPEQLAKVVEETINRTAESIVQVNKRLHKVAGTALIIGGMTGVTAGVAMGGTELQKHAHWVVPMVTSITTFVMTAFGSPLFDSISGFIRPRAYRLLNRQSPHLGELETGKALMKIHGRLSQTLNSNQQTARSALSAFYDRMEKSLNQMSYLMMTERPNPTTIDRTADILANTIIYLRKYYPEQSLDNEDIYRASYLLFVKYTDDADRVALMDKCLKSIGEFDSRASEPKVKDYYEYVVKKILHLDQPESVQ